MKIDQRSAWSLKFFAIFIKFNRQKYVGFLFIFLFLRSEKYQRNQTQSTEIENSIISGPDTHSIYDVHDRNQGTSSLLYFLLFIAIFIHHFMLGNFSAVSFRREYFIIEREISMIFHAHLGRSHPQFVD